MALANTSSQGRLPSPDVVEKTSCIRVCRLDDQKTHCTGCGRTLEEIKQAGERAATATKDTPMRHHLPRPERSP